MGILVGGIFAWYAIRIGFYETWTIFFNVLVAIYLAIFLGPVVVEIVPGAGDTVYSNTLAILAVAIVSFLILHGISYVFFIGQFKISFPKVLDILGTGIWGFLAGFLIWSFVSLLICITPISQNTFVKEVGFGSQSQQASISYICWWCDLVNTFVASKDNPQTTEQVISELLKSVEKKAHPSPVEPDKPYEAAEPSKPAEPNAPES